MNPTWQIRVKNAAGSLVAILSDYEGFSFTKRVNSPGGYALRFARVQKPNQAEAEADAEFLTRIGYFELDGQIEFWRRVESEGIDWYLEYEAFHRTASWYVDVDGVLKFESRGRGYLDLLGRTIVNEYAGTTGSKKSGAAETVLKEYVDEQLVNPTDSDRDRTGLSVQADGAGGNTVELQRSYKNVLEVCQYIASIGGGDFDIVGTGAATFELRWYTGQRGTDRSSSVLFAYERGNMGSPRLTYARHDEVNAVRVGGQGEKEGRELVWRTTAGLIDDSTWNRCEMYRDARNESTTGGLNAVGDAELDTGKPRYALTFQPLQTPGCLLGKHYFFGDKVGSKFLTFSGTQQVKGYTVTVDSRGEQVGVEVEDV